MSISKPVPVSPEERKRIRTQYKEAVLRGAASASAAKHLGFSKYSMYRMFVMDNDNWRARYGPYDSIKAIVDCRASGKDPRDWCAESGIPYYKYQSWIAKWGENPTLPKEPKNRVMARTGGPIWSPPKTEKPVTHKRKIAAAVKAAPKNASDGGVLSTLWRESEELKKRLAAIERDMAGLIKFLGVKEME